MDSIRKLSKHQVLIEGGNKDINGKILEEYSNFGLGDTRISGCLPVYFGKLKRFRTLSIYTTMVSSEIPKEMVTSSLAYVSDKALNFVFPD
ncbi:hypothetical protein RYX36_029570 [Vicia faba]